VDGNRDDRQRRRVRNHRSVRTLLAVGAGGTHESRSRPRAPNSLKANKRSASITTTTPRPPTASYYEVELFFEDGSTKTIGLTASETGVSVAASDYAEYQALIEEMEEPATERGFEATPRA